MKNFTLCFVIGMILLSSTLNAQKTNLSWDEYVHQKLLSKNIDARDASFIITQKYTSSLSGIQNIYFRQSINGLEIFGTESGVHILPDGKELKFYPNFVSDIVEKTVGGTTPSLSAVQAVQLAATHLNYSVLDPLVEISSQNNAARETLISKGSISKQDIPVKLMYEKLNDGSVVLIWYLIIQSTSNQDWFSVRVNANTGEVLGKVNWTTSCNYDHDHEVHLTHQEKIYGSQNFTKNNLLLAGSYEVIPYPLESPLFGNRAVVPNPANPIASPFGWHDTNGIAGAEFTVTSGNNVNAFKGGSVNTGFQPEGGTSLVFHFPFDINYTDENPFTEASLTNLFYWNNLIHDVVYQYGFDEAAGNFQVNNYGKGGMGNDPVNAVGLISWNCNAFFSTPPDGQPGIMEMYYCSVRDGSFDNIVTLHEYAHGISIRSTGGPANSDCLWNGEQMGEGWSDWYGLMLTMDADDTREDNRTIATYLLNQTVEGSGIRSVPYTTDMAINSLTYDDIKTANGPHQIGTVWATMLWEMTWSLIDEYGFDADIYNGTGGNNIALALVTEGLKLQPCNPGFVDARDGILAADMALYGGVNQCIILEAFAKRGLGVNASQGSPFDPFDGVESFETPSSAVLNLVEKVCISDGIVANLGGGLPVGGVYSGAGVSDDGNGTTFTLDTNAVGLGVHTVNYSVAESICVESSTASDTIEVMEFFGVNCPEDIQETLVLGDTYFLPDYYESGILTFSTYCLLDDVSVVQTPAPGTSLPVGTHTIAFEITDAYNNKFFCDFQLELNSVLSTDEISFNENSVQLYPNPTTDKVKIVNESKTKIISVSVVDASGKLLQKTEVNQNENEMEISLNSYPAGVYFIKLNSDKDQIIKSVIKK